jgi:hypothetical protein
MQQAKITEKDEVFFDVLKYKIIGSEVNKLEFHLDAAAKSLKIIKNTCKQVEEETGISINFIYD